MIPSLTYTLKLLEKVIIRLKDNEISKNTIAYFGLEILIYHLGKETNFTYKVL
jgi:hypothetical protein